MRKTILFGFAALLLASCTGTPAATWQTVQPVASELACAAQAGANLSTQSLDQVSAAQIVKGGASKTVAEAELASALGSAIAGTFCNGLQQGAPLPKPVAVTGATATVNGVTLPVPVTSAAVPVS